MLSVDDLRIKNLLNNCNNKTIAVVGDVMIDRFFWGSVSRVSPEAPVPVIDIENETNHLGGAANVANNLQSLGIKPLLCGVIGNDNTGIRFIEIANNLGINTSGLFKDDNRPTTIKTRIIGNNQHIARLDREVRTAIPSKGESYIMNCISNSKDISAIIIADYNKGTLSEFLIKEIINYSLLNNIPIFVDPKIDHFFDYKNVTVFKPNRKEASQALGMTIKTNEDILKAGQELISRLNCSNLILTLGKDGMTLFDSEGEIFQVPTHALHISDVSGAGDTAIATCAAMISAGAKITEAASIANYAAGVVCEQPGVVPITKEELINFINKNRLKN